MKYKQVHIYVLFTFFRALSEGLKHVRDQSKKWQGENAQEMFWRIQIKIYKSVPWNECKYLWKGFVDLWCAILIHKRITLQFKY